jgi:hypothetical protein
MERTETGGPWIVDVRGYAAEMGLQLCGYRIGLLRVSQMDFSLSRP